MKFIKTEIPEVVIIEPRLFNGIIGSFCKFYVSNNIIIN